MIKTTIQSACPSIITRTETTHRPSILFYLLFLFFLPTIAVQAAAPEKDKSQDSVRFSLLTCAAGGEIYALFGHTAIRYQNFTQGIDAVFNYGMFDFNAPHFIFRFALGETDYQLGMTTYERFAAEYSYLGRDVWQQTLNLNQKEKERLIYRLMENYRLENRRYRYNFFYDNCATRPRDQIEHVIDGTLLYADDMIDNDARTSFRDLLHEYSEGHPWARFGMDLCMGSKADEPISRRQMMFVPFYLQAYFNKAQIVSRDGEMRPLVTSEEKIVVTGRTPADFRTGGITPLQAALSLLLVVAVATVGEVCRRNTRNALWVMDLVLFLAAGIAGSILAFLTLFSRHPAVSPNYLLFVFHPLHLFCLPYMLKSIRKKSPNYYMWGNAFVLTAFIGLWAVIPQRIPLTVLPLALCLLIRSASNLMITYRRIE